MVVTVPEVPSRWKWRPATRLGDAVARLERGDGVGHRLDHLGVVDPGDVGAAIFLGQADDAAADRGLVEQARRPALLHLQPHQLGRSAADVEDDGIGMLRIGQGGTARHREIGFGLPVDHLEFQVKVLADALDEGLAVLGQSAGLGCHEASPRHVLGGHLVPADAQRIESSLDGVLAELVAEPEPLAEPNDPREGIGDTKTEMGGLRDQEAAIVGAEVESGIAPGTAPPRARMIGGR